MKASFGVTGVGAGTASSTVTVAPAPAPSPSQPPSSSSSSCFAGTELVTLETGASKTISEVTVGDRILTVNAQGQQVYSDVTYVPHGKNAQKATFTMVSTEMGRNLKMTANHMLPAGACPSRATLPVVLASTVAVGDCVETVSGRERVVSVSTVEGEGIYTVIAMEELLVVNGIVTTPYGGVNPVVANLFYNMFRVLYLWGFDSTLRHVHTVTTLWAHVVCI